MVPRLNAYSRSAPTGRGPLAPMPREPSDSAMNLRSSDSCREMTLVLSGLRFMASGRFGCLLIMKSMIPSWPEILPSTASIPMCGLTTTPGRIFMHTGKYLLMASDPDVACANPPCRAENTSMKHKERFSMTIGTANSCGFSGSLRSSEECRLWVADSAGWSAGWRCRSSCVAILISCAGNDWSTSLQSTRDYKR